MGDLDPKDVRYWRNQHGSGFVISGRTLELLQRHAYLTGMELEPFVNKLLDDYARKVLIEHGVDPDNIPEDLGR